MFPYSIPENRPLTSAEVEFIEFLLREHAPERIGDLEGLEVIGRCGCGQCPGILFSASSTDHPAGQKPYVVVDMITSGPPDGPIGVMLWGTDSELTELELYSLGESEVTELPPVADLKPFAA